MKLTREIKVAVLVITSIILFYWGFLFLKGKNLFGTTTKYTVVYENVFGLNMASPVTISGLVVGKLNKIKFLEEGKISVEFEITNPDVKISKNAIAEIMDSGLIGGREINITNNKENFSEAESGTTLKSASRLGLTDKLAKEVKPISEKLQLLLDDVDVLVKGMNNTLNAQTQQNIKSALANLDKTLTDLDKTVNGVNGLVTENKQKIGNVVSEFEKTSKNTTALTEKLSKLELEQTIKNFESTLAKVNGIMANLENGQGTMGKMFKDDVLYNNMAKTSKELELLLQDLRLYPTRYVNVSLFGKKNKPYQSPENTTEKK